MNAPLGTLLQIPLPDGRFGGAQLIGFDPPIVRLFGVIWACAPGPLDFADAPVAVEHLAVPPARVAQLSVVGHLPPPPEGDDHALWLAGGRPVVDAPLATLLLALLD